MKVPVGVRPIVGGTALTVAALVFAAACSSSAAAPAGAGAYGAGNPGPTATPQAAGATVVVGMVQDPKLGPMLVDGKGLTLYLYKPDGPNHSACTGGCAEAWPPLVVPAGSTPAAGSGASGSLTTFARPDGSMQVAYNGTPLYYCVKDTKAGDTAGQGVGGIWFVVAP